MTRKDKEGFSTKVTPLGDGRYGCRVLKDGKLYSEARAESKGDIASTIRELLRWADKNGSGSSMASASRDRWQKRAGLR